MLIALAVLALAYRYYAAFLAAYVLSLSDARETAAHACKDGQNFHPTNRWVLFGHHFAAITGAGPLIGPVLAAQFGFLPGYLWILFGVVLGGAVHDFVILVASTRRKGASLAAIARDELGPVLGGVTAAAILFIVVIALAGLGKVVVSALTESAWGAFTIACSIPIALAMGLWIYKVRGGSDLGIREASAVGVVLLLGAVAYGKVVHDGPLGAWFRLDATTLTFAIASYGFIASVLPVWMLLCPRDYLSSYLKIGTIGALVLGILIVNPAIEMPLVNAVDGKSVQVLDATYPAVVRGQLFPFVFITIACGAISGFHALVASGTTPKMIDRERDCRPIGYGAMLCEGLVGITALLAATALPPADYFAINTDPRVPMVSNRATDPAVARSVGDLPGMLEVATEADRRALGIVPSESILDIARHKVPVSSVLRLSTPALIALGYGLPNGTPNAGLELGEDAFLRLGVPVTELPALARDAGEVVAARTGGAVSLAIGMARVFSGLPGMKALLAYWYHFAIMFEALFVLTTIDTGTRVGRFLLQEIIGRAVPRFADPAWLPGATLSSLAIVAGFSWFILTGNIATIWPMFGVANQLLATAALAVGTTILLREAPRASHALVTLLPMLFVATTTISAGVLSVVQIYVPMSRAPETRLVGTVNATVTTALLVGVIVLLVGCVARWPAILRARTAPTPRSAVA
jgi:carbon starvation protein